MVSTTGTWMPLGDDEAQFLARRSGLLKLIFEDGYEETHSVSVESNPHTLTIGHSGRLVAMQFSDDDGTSWWPV